MRPQTHTCHALLLLLLLLLASCGTRPDEDALDVAAPARGVVRVYSARELAGLETLLNRFTHETGIAVELTQGSSQELLTRLQQEADAPRADALFEVDAGHLVRAAEAGLLQPLDSALLRERVPPALRDEQGRWFALTQRVRVIVYRSEVAADAALLRYESLGEPRWRGRLCLLEGQQAYTISLVAHLIGTLGAERAQSIVGGWVANAPRYLASDALIVEALASGVCDVGLVNQDALGRALAENPFLPLQLAWPDQPASGGAGAHRNISGIGVTRGAPNREHALELAEWLSGAGQAADRYGLPGGSFEYPVNRLAAPHPTLAAFGRYQVASLPPAELGRLHDEALDLLERMGYGA
jgi:iron(III) transport system substrate-binding protein